MQTWEYSVIYINPDDFHQVQNGIPLATRALNRKGQEGWEAVAVTDLESSRKAILLKRPCHGQRAAADPANPGSADAAAMR